MRKSGEELVSDRTGRIKKCVQRWFGHVENMDGESMAEGM